MVHIFIKMTYNAEGVILVPFVTTKGHVSQVVRNHFQRKIEIFTTLDGDLNSDLVCLMMYNIYKYVFSMLISMFRTPWKTYPIFTGNTIIVHCIDFRYLSDNQMNASPVIYLCPRVSQHLAFFMWDLCNKYNYIIQTVPHNIHRYFRTCNMGIFEKTRPKFQEIVRKKLVYLSPHKDFI